MDGCKALLGIWISENEGAKFWLGVCNELQSRGLNDIFVACIDGRSFALYIASFGKLTD